MDITSPPIRVQASIEVLAVRRLDGTSTIKAFCDVRLGGVVLRGCKVVQQPDQRPWLAMPSVKTEHGWLNVVELSRPLRERVTEAVLAAWAIHEPRADPDQHDTGDPARPFDDQIPF